MPRTNKYNLTALALCVAAASTPTQAAAVLGLGDLEGGTFYSAAHGVSGNGSVIVGQSSSSGGGEAFRWTQSSGIQGLGYLTGGDSNSWASAVSADGLVIVGLSDSIHGVEAFRWTQPSGMQGLGFLGESYDLSSDSFIKYSSASGASSDGSVIVGHSSSNDGTQAFRWTQALGMQGLGFLGSMPPAPILPPRSNSTYSWASGVSADGLVIVGNSSSEDGLQAFRWTQAHGMQGLGDLAGGTFSSMAFAASADGSVIVGTSESTFGLEAFRWTQVQGMQGLGDLPEGTFSSSASGVSANGAVIVGIGSSAYGNEPFRWTEAAGMQSLTNWLAEGGINSAGWSFTTNNDFGNALDGVSVSADGTTIVGFGQHDGNTEAFAARANALVSLNDLANSLGSSSQALVTGQRSLETLINGAHSRPLSRRVAVNDSTAWLAGDWGRDAHGQRDGDLGLTEFGGGHNFGPVQINLAVGQTWANQDQSLNSSMDADNTYVLLETIVPVNEAMGLWATIGGVLAWGENDIKRGYMNGSNVDHSSASPDTQSYALHARLDWENAYELSQFQISPYSDLIYANGKQDSYNETGGGLPANFDSQRESTTDLRLGLQGTYPLGQSGISLISLMEQTHRFDDASNNTSGEVPGLFSFDLPGSNYEQNWQRLGLGVEGQLGSGKASLMLNGTTQGEMPSSWLAASYQLTF